MSRMKVFSINKQKKEDCSYNLVIVPTITQLNSFFNILFSKLYIFQSAIKLVYEETSITLTKRFRLSLQHKLAIDHSVK